MKDGGPRPHGRAWLGGACLLVALLFSVPVLALFSPDGSIDSRQLRATIVVIQVAFALTGVGILRKWDRLQLLRGSLGRAIVGIVATGFALVAGELLVRMLMGPLSAWAPPPVYVGEVENRPSRNFVADPLIGWRMRPGVEFQWSIDGRANDYVASQDGFRSPYESADLFPRSDDLVVVVGDSFAFGTGVADDSTFRARLERVLTEARVHNMALPGMGFDQMWDVLRHHAIPLRPDVVVIAFIDADWDRSLTAYRFVEGMTKPTYLREDDGLRLAVPGDAPPPPLKWLERHSALLGLTRVAQRKLGARYGVGPWWRTNAAILDAMTRDARSARVPLVLVRLPTRGSRELPALEREAARLDLRYLDLAADHPEGIHFATDDHINDAGHAWVADRIAVAVGEVLRR